MVRPALAESRPFLLLSLIAGISYWFFNEAYIPGPVLMVWKAAGVGFLVPYALTRHNSLAARMIALVMALGALGDLVLEIDFQAGAIVFMAAHVVAIALYLMHRRATYTPSQLVFAAVLVPASVFIAWSLPYDRGAASGVAFYTAVLSLMVASAWLSRFSRYHVGIGVLLFLLSDLLLIARQGPLETSMIPDLLVWPTYYFGQFLICTGVIRKLRAESGLATP